MTHYDVIIAGGGAAGLSLAYHLACSPLRDLSLLIVDQEAKEQNDHTFCFWTDRPMPCEGIGIPACVSRSWDRLQVVGGTFSKVIELGAYRYTMICGSDLYRRVRQELATHGTVTFLQGTVTGIEDGADEATAVVDGQRYGGRWVFDSCFGRSAYHPDPARYYGLLQQFTGWEIATPARAFDPQVPTFLDFRTPQRDALRFFYVLPLSECRALVEYVVVAAAQVGAAEGAQALDSYLVGVLGVTGYQVERSEGGITPLTDQPFPRRTGARIMTIGVLGGRVKPSTGFAFLRIQQDSAAIVRSLLTAGHPFAVPPDSARYRLYDALLLQLMSRRPAQVAPILTALFKNNPIERVYRFLDERASLVENLALIATLPPPLFLHALFRRWVLHRV